MSGEIFATRVAFTTKAAALERAENERKALEQDGRCPAKGKNRTLYRWIPERKMP